MLLLHGFQFVHHDMPLAGGQLVTSTVFPQSILIGKGSDDLLAIHQIRNNVRTLQINRVRAQIETRAQCFDDAAYILGPLLGRMPSTLGIQIEQGVLLHHHRNARRYRPQRINALFLQCQLHRIGRIARQLHLLHFHP